MIVPNIKPRKKTKKCIALDKDLWASIDIQANERRQSRSEFINEILSIVVGSTKSFLTFELMRLSREMNYAKYQAENHNQEDIKDTIERLRGGR